jgi:hypothetical protein
VTGDTAGDMAGLEAVVAELYGLPPERFVAARDELVRQLRARSDRGTARRVQTLRRPTLSVWVANQLARASPEAAQRLVDVGAALQAAQQQAVAGETAAGRRLRPLVQAQRQAIDRLVRHAAPLLSDAGYGASQATLLRLAATLQAAAATEPGRVALATGRLTRDLDPAAVGFGLPPREAGASEAGQAPPPSPAPSSAATPPPPPASASASDVAIAQAAWAAARAAAQEALAAARQGETEAVRRAASERQAADRAAAAATSAEEHAARLHATADELDQAARALTTRAQAAAASAAQAAATAAQLRAAASADVARAEAARSAATDAQVARAAAEQALSALDGAS